MNKLELGKPVMVALFCNMSQTAKNFKVHFYDNKKKCNAVPRLLVSSAVAVSFMYFFF